jgi:hypothetical protein
MDLFLQQPEETGRVISTFENVLKIPNVRKDRVTSSFGKFLKIPNVPNMNSTFHLEIFSKYQMFQMQISTFAKYQMFQTQE